MVKGKMTAAEILNGGTRRGRGETDIYVGFGGYRFIVELKKHKGLVDDAGARTYRGEVEQRRLTCAAGVAMAIAGARGRRAVRGRPLFTRSYLTTHSVIGLSQMLLEHLKNGVSEPVCSEHSSILAQHRQGYRRANQKRHKKQMISEPVYGSNYFLLNL